MGGLLGNARRFFSGMTPARPVGKPTYRIACHCGQRLSGDRTKSYQALKCPNCGSGLFVLPISPLPEPPAPSGSERSSETVDQDRRTSPAGKRTKAGPNGKQGDVDESPVALQDVDAASARSSPTPPKPDDESVEDEVQWDDEDEDDGGRTGSTADPVEAAMDEQAKVRSKHDGTKKNRDGKPRSGNDSARQGVKRSDSDSELETITIPERSTFSEFLWKHRNPLLLSIVALIVFGTVARRQILRRWEQWPVVAERGRTLGLEALDAGEFDKAQQLLSDAKRAVDAMGGAFQGSEAIRQGADEAAIIARLIPSSLEDMLDEATQIDAQEWRNQFQSLYQGRSIIVEAQLASAPNTRGEGDYDLDYRVLPIGEGGKPKSSARIDLRGFRLLGVIKPKLGDTLLFGARLSSFQFDVDRNEWLIALEPDSGVIMTHTKALEALGWPTGGELSENEASP